MGIFRGVGGTGNSTDDGIVDAVTEQAVIATNKAGEALNSANSASSSASSATTSASSASTSATNAATSATAAQTAQTAAETAETNAESSATSASTSASTATTKASEASTSATNAATSETNAATSASTATTKASEAATSATTATTKAGEASTSATNAAASATSASTSASTATTKASEASTSAASAASSYDDFDDRYLGAKSSAPSTDNDGDALVTGALYFDTTLDTMEVWSGSAWIDAYSSATGVLLSSNNLSDLNNVGTARTNLGLGTAATTDASAYATAAQADQTVSLTGSGATSVSGTYPNFTISSTDNNTTYSVGDGGLTEINFTSADNTKLDGIESGATADQTAAEIKTAYESNADTNAFTDSDSTKLSGIEASADVTDTANVTAAGALMDSELTSEASVKALNQGVATTDSPSFVNLTLSGTGSVKVPSGTTAQRDGSPANGMFRYNSTNEQFEGYQSGAWGAIGGGGGSNTFTADTFTGDGSTTAYALSQVVNSEDNLLVFIAGVFQQQSAYSIATASGTTTLTFATAPANTREIIVYSVASAVSGTNLNIDSMTGDGSDTTLSLSINPVNENNTQVFIDGVYQNKDTYSISGTTLTFSTAPPTGSAVEVMTMTQTEINVPVDGTITPAKIASGDFYFDTDTLYIDATNDNVGVGTSTPNTNLGAYNGVSIDATNAALQLQGTNFSSVLFGDSADADVGGVLYDHSSDAMRFYANGSERARILSTGGITFNGDTAQANALDDYEEGTFTAVYVGSTVAGSSPSITSYYTKIGRLVTVTITHNNFTATSASGNLRYTGLPFVASSTGGSHGAVGVSANISSTTLVASVLSGTDYIQVRNANTTVFSTVANASSMYFLTTISYITDL